MPLRVHDAAHQGMGRPEPDGDRPDSLLGDDRLQVRRVPLRLDLEHQPAAPDVREPEAAAGIRRRRGHLLVERVMLVLLEPADLGVLDRVPLFASDFAGDLDSARHDLHVGEVAETFHRHLALLWRVRRGGLAVHAWMPLAVG